MSILSSRVRNYLLAFSNYILMTFLALIFALPIIFMLVSSLKPHWQILQDSSTFRAFLPVGDLTFLNYIEAFKQAPIAQFLINSAFVTTITVICGLFLNSMAGFALSRLQLRFNYLILPVIIATMIIPFEAIAIPLLLIVNNLPWINANGITLGWLNSYHVQIFPFIADAYSIYLFYQFFKVLPRELFDLAQIEGANWFQIFLWIVIPLSGPVYATAAILKFLVMWNQYLWPVLVIQTDKYRPIMVGYGYFGGGGGISMAYLTLATLPVLILFFLFQHSFIKSISNTSHRG